MSGSYLVNKYLNKTNQNDFYSIYHKENGDLKQMGVLPPIIKNFGSKTEGQFGKRKEKFSANNEDHFKVELKKNRNKQGNYD